MAARSLLVYNWHKARDLSRGVGRWNALLCITDRVLMRLTGDRVRFFKYLLVAQPVAQGPLLPASRGRRIVVRELRLEDLDEVALPRPPAMLHDRFEAGDRCLGAFIGQELVGFIWLCFRPYDEEAEVRCTFLPAPQGIATWDYDLYIEPRHRVGFVFARLWDAANELLRTYGVRWTVSRVSAFNVGSINSHKRLGSIVVDRAFFVKLGRLQIMQCSGGIPRLHLSTRTEDRPRLIVAVDGVGPR
jgi:hypothetical protein